MRIVTGWDHSCSGRAMAAMAGVLLLAGCGGSSLHLPPQPRAPELSQTVSDFTRAKIAEALMLNGDAANAAEALRSPAEREAAQQADPIDNATLFVVAGQVDKGMKMARAALAAHADDPPFALRVGKLAVRANRLADAADIYGQISKKHPDNVEALNGIGVVRAQQGDLAGAEQSLRKALALRPLDVPARGNLALVLMLEGRSAAAVPVLEDLQRTNPSQQVSALLTLALQQAHPAGAS